MNFKTSATKIAALAAVVAFPLSLAACGDTASTSSAPASSAAAAPSSSAASTPAMTPSASASASDASAPFGAGCAAVPTSGKGSFDGMSQDPVATAASNNPALSTLVTAVKAAGLVDTLNNANNITVFAPTNDAFKKIPAATLKKVLADKKTLTAILTGHVVSGKLSPTELAGDHTSLAKTTVKVTGSGED
ncbi:MAG: fasciclin domain-containing protein, partial [Janthinobacterium lividum]